jgi:DNA-binding transcriptional LysR family regulator
MELRQLRCFVAAADELHFGRAAQQLDMLPAAFGREIRLLEEDLGAPLFLRTTRHVALTVSGRELLDEARRLIAQVDAMALRFRATRPQPSGEFRIGVIDTAAAGLMPSLLHDFRGAHSDFAMQIIEDKTIRLLPKLLSGRLDLAFVRPPAQRDARITFRHLLNETPVVALPTGHPLAACAELSITDLADQQFIVPDRRSRPHSYDVTLKLFAAAGLTARIGQVADEKQTIVHLVAAGLGVAIVPRWTSQLAVSGVVYRPLKGSESATASYLPLAVAYLRGARDVTRDALLDVLERNLARYALMA